MAKELFSFQKYCSAVCLLCLESVLSDLFPQLAPILGCPNISLGLTGLRVGQKLCVENNHTQVADNTPNAVADPVYVASKLSSS